MRRPETKVPGSPWQRMSRAAQAKGTSSLESTPHHPTAGRPYRRPFPCPSLRYYFRRPSLLAVALESDFWAGRREAA